MKPEKTYHNLASLAKELQMEGNLNPQRVKELQDMFSDLKSETETKNTDVDIDLEKKSLEVLYLNIFTFKLSSIFKVLVFL